VGYLAEIEGGKKPGSAGTLCRIARILDVSMEHLVMDTAPVPRRSVTRDAAPSR
jgi:transcriptional regulator with XRE-family HTH domain